MTRALLVLLALSLPARAEPAPEPFRLVRVLQRLQDMVSHGSVAAQGAQRQVIEDAGAAVSAASPDVWGDRRNVDALAILILSGAPARLAEAALAAPSLDPAAKAILQTVTALARGRANALADLAIEGMSPALAGHIALAAGTLAAREAPASADRLFDQARLALPGGLVEETALRRQAVLAAERADAIGFARAASRVLRRFPRSLYAPAFTAGLDRRVVVLALADEASLAPLLAALPSTMQASVRLAVGQAALRVGRPALAVTVLAGEDGDSRATLTLGVARLFGADIEKTRASLAAIDTADLAPEDAQLARAGLRLADALLAWPPVDQPSDERQALAPGAVEARALRLLAATTTALRRDAP